MEQHRAIPPGYMTVGEIAKKMGVTVRTLQYYDRGGLFSPSGESEGGRRLYTDKDMVRLHQILSLKFLGFSLGDIKHRLVSLDTPEEVAQALSEHAAVIREKLSSLQDALQAVEALHDEVLAIQTVDFAKYADIIVNLRMKNEMYWVIKHFDDKTLAHVRSNFDQESGTALVERFKRVQEQALALLHSGTAPGSEEGLAFAKEYWDMIEEFSGGDMRMLPKLMEIGDKVREHDDSWARRIEESHAFIEPALQAYFTKINYNPFETQEETNT